MAQTPGSTDARAQRKTRVGVVVSNRMTKTIVVRVEQLVRHPKYNRVISHTSKFKAHDEAQSAAIGDRVKIMETRPISRDKRWRLVEIVERASTAPPVPDQEAAPQPRPSRGTRQRRGGEEVPTAQLEGEPRRKAAPADAASMHAPEAGPS